MPLLVFTFLWQRDPSRAATLGLAFYALGIFCNNPHYMATLHRAYHSAGDFRKYRFFTVYVTLLLGLALVLVHLAPALAPWVITLYLTWSPWHYTGQNFGIAQLLLRRAGAPADPAARALLHGGYVAAFVVWAAALHAARPSPDPVFLGLGLPVRLADALQFGGALAWAGLSAAAFFRLARHLPWRAMVGPVLLSATQALWFVLPALATRLGSLELPASYFSAGVLAFMHCAQYLWITTYYARRGHEGDPAPARGGTGSGARRPFSFLRYYLALVIGGIALFVPGPWIASRVFGHDFVRSFLIFMALVNLHHFILDGAVWKLRDGRLARLLLGQRDPGEDSAEAALRAAGGNPSARHHLGWLFGASRSARLTRPALAALLVGVAVLDQWQYAASSRSTSEDALARAAALNPFDPRPAFRRAQRLVALGETEEARRELKVLLARNPRNAPAQHLLGEVLMRQGDTEAALAHYRRMAELFPADLAIFTNLGLLLAESGRPDEALRLYDRALRLAPARAELQALRGRALIAAGRPEEGRRELEKFCALHESRPADPATLDHYLEIALFLGRARLDEGDLAGAERRLQGTADVAATHRRFAVAAESLRLLARLQAEQGRENDARATFDLAARAAGFASEP